MNLGLELWACAKITKPSERGNNSNNSSNSFLFYYERKQIEVTRWRLALEKYHLQCMGGYHCFNNIVTLTLLNRIAKKL